MGWSGGTDVARRVITIAKDALKPECKADFYKKLINVLEDHDWDCQYEAKGIDPEFDKVLRRRR